MDQAARKEGTSKWKESILEALAGGTGNAPGGQNTRAGILVGLFNFIQCRTFANFSAAAVPRYTEED
jgi:hypothetical protein